MGVTKSNQEKEWGEMQHCVYISQESKHFHMFSVGLSGRTKSKCIFLNFLLHSRFRKLNVISLRIFKVWMWFQWYDGNAKNKQTKKHTDTRAHTSVFRGMDDVLCLILILWDVPSRNQPGATLAPLGKNKMAARYFKVSVVTWAKGRQSVVYELIHVII